MMYRRISGGAFLLALVCTLSAPVASAQAPAALVPEAAQLLSGLAEAPTTVRVASFNVHYAHDVSALAESIRASATLSRADVLLIQEIEHHDAEGTSRTRQLAEKLGLNFVYAPARAIEAGGTHGLAILSRFALADVEVLELPRYDLGYRTRRRIAVGVTVDVGGRLLRVYNLHLDTRINTQDRLAQLVPVLQAAEKHGVAEVVIGGDFNTNPLRWLFHRVPLFRSDQAGAVDELMRERGYQVPLAESGSTMKKAMFRARLDALYPRGLDVRESGVDRGVSSSDHFPVWLDLAWPPGSETAKRK